MEREAGSLWARARDRSSRRLRATKTSSGTTVGLRRAVPRPTHLRPRHLFSVLFIIALFWIVPGTIQKASAASDPVIGAAGDIACDPSNASFNGGLGTSSSCRQKYTASLLASMNPAAVLDLGDNQYYCGGYQAYLQSYDLSWGALKSITHPSVGNHEYLTSGGTDCSPTTNAAGYFQYFGSAAGQTGQGYYSFDVGTWHIIALNTNCGNAGGCSSGSPQYNWLQSDLAAHTNYCTLAFWHIPLYSSGGRAASNSQSFWNLLYAYNADLILSGHDHIYERFAPQNPTGGYDPVRGIREFIVGTGGANHTSLVTTAANSEVRNTDTFGVLQLTLHATSYDWQFVPESGKTFTDSGTQNCHDASGLATATATSSLPTSTPTATGTPLPATATPTATSASQATNTPSATDTPLPATATPTATSVLLNTSTPTSTFTPLPPTFTPTPTTTGSSGGSVTFLPVADSYVNSSLPTNNYGTSTSLRADGSPIVNGYVRFTVSALNGALITRVRLLFYMNSSSSAGMQALTVADNTWGEKTITYSNAPAMGSTIAISGALSTGTWVTLDVTSYVTAEGTYSFGVITPGSTAINFASRESGANAPQLIVDLGP